jgi:deoxyribodipyrimidine photo-lyase
MSTPGKIGIMYFRRDLRISDNTALVKCIGENDKIFFIFLYNPAQINDRLNNYFSAKAFNLLQNFVTQLSADLKEQFGAKLHALHGGTAVIGDIMAAVKKQHPTSAITLYYNADFTPFSIMRDTKIFQLAVAHGVKIKAYIDHLLTLNSEITDVKQLYPDEKSPPYKKFTPFYLNSLKSDKIMPIQRLDSKVIKGVEFPDIKMPSVTKMPAIKATEYNRKAALAQLKQNINYYATHDTPAVDTFRISHYLKFGVISIREAYFGLKQITDKKSREAVLRQLYWRDFYTLLAWHYPKLLGWQCTITKTQLKWTKLKENSALSDNYNKIHWDDESTSAKSKEIVAAWKTGVTGFPIVDAGMRQLAAIGYMHNRVRLITASFLTKICGIDWRIGERWFAQHLIDYDPIINNGNWLWVAGGGADSQPYFRVFNPWLQQHDHDPDAIYIKRWVPELIDVDAKLLHNWFDYEDGDKKIKYPAPIIDYALYKERTYKKYKSTLAG